ncbi:MAG: DUF2987 domain-containing protein [Pseudomonadota bacterium]
MKKTLLLSTLVLLSTQVIAAENREWISYKKLVETVYLDKFYAAPAAARDKVLVVPVVHPVNKAIKESDVVFTVDKQVMAVNKSGQMDFVFNPQWVADGTMIYINQPKGEKMGMGMEMLARLPDGTQWNYATLMGSVKQANELIKTAAGALSLFAPKIKVVTLKFAKPAQLTIQGKAGVLKLASDAKGEIVLKPEEGLMQENPLMVLSERPTVASLD